MKKLIALLIVLVLLLAAGCVSKTPDASKPSGTDFNGGITESTDPEPSRDGIQLPEIEIGDEDPTDATGGNGTDADPTDPTSGTQSTDPTSGTQTTDPTTGTESTDPTTGTESTDPTTGTESTDPTSSTESTENSDPITLPDVDF